jgi:hypothetical protein
MNTVLVEHLSEAERERLADRLDAVGNLDALSLEGVDGLYFAAAISASTAAANLSGSGTPATG